jgi:hypothetical protein
VRVRAPLIGTLWMVSADPRLRSGTGGSGMSGRG